jgi:hypothetical protein
MTEQQTPASVVERLRSHKDYPGGTAYARVYRNPDGLEAAALIERLSAEREGLAKVFSDVMFLRKDHPGQTERFYAEEASAICRRGLAALSTQGESRQTGWQDIATAPKDGARVILYAAAWEMTWGEVQVGHYEGDGEGGGEWVTAEGAVGDNDPAFDPEAECPDYDCDDDWNVGPTHWMPLPAAPTPADGGGE